MSELVTVEKPKQQEKTLTPLKLEALGKGIGNINAGYPLHKAIVFIKDLNINTSIWTGQSENALGIAFPTPSFSKINRIKQFDSTIFITGPLKKQEPEFRAQGERQIWHPTGFRAEISLSNDKEKNSQKVEKIEISTKLSKKALELMIEKTIGEIPQNWHINPRITEPHKS